MNTHTTLGRRLVAVLGAAAIGLIGLAGAANAEVGPDQPNAPTGGTLTINKYAGSPVATPDPESHLDGVEFTVTRVGRSDGEDCTAINLTKAADWDGLAGDDGLFKTAPNAPTGDFCLTTTTFKEKTVDGKAVFDLDVGVYYVEETADHGGNNIVSKVPSFYVSIPTSDSEEEGGWNYDVVADPKNQVMDRPSKTIDTEQDDLVLGSDVTWTITAPVPTLNNDETFTEAVITDSLDSRLAYVLDSSVVTVGDTTLTDGTDYNVTESAIWTLTESGRSVLDQHMGNKLTITFKTTVKSVGDGTISNSDYKSTFNGTTVPGEVIPYTYWGELSILKVDDSNNKLKGAEFKVFDTDAEGQCPSSVPTEPAVATGTSDGNGIVQWSGASSSGQLGLWVASSENGPASNPSKNYCVYETIVPAGHTATVINNPIAITPGEETIRELTVVNSKTEGPSLPLTGANGELLMTVGGLALVLLAGGGALVVRSRRHQS